MGNYLRTRVLEYEHKGNGTVFDLEVEGTGDKVEYAVPFEFPGESCDKIQFWEGHYTCLSGRRQVISHKDYDEAEFIRDNEVLLALKGVDLDILTRMRQAPNRAEECIKDLLNIIQAEQKWE